MVEKKKKSSHPPNRATGKAKQQLYAQARTNPSLTKKQCANIAGLKGSGASVRAAEMEKLPEVAAAIQQSREKLAEELNTTARHIVQELAYLGYSDIRNVMSWDNNGIILKSSDTLPDFVSRSISEISEKVDKEGNSTFRIKLHSKDHALELLGKWLEMFKETSKSELILNLNLTENVVLKLHELEKVERLKNLDGSVNRIGDHISR